VARLLFRSVRLSKEPRRILVVPGELESDRKEMFLKLGIHVIPCAWEKGTAVFDGLAEQLGERNR
jgi:ribosome biogenesis protein Tsr3